MPLGREDVKMILLLNFLALLANFGRVESCNPSSIPTFVLGKCPSVTTVPNFDVTRYLGDWYSQRQTTSSFQPAGQVTYNLRTLNEYQLRTLSFERTSAMEL